MFGPDFLRVSPDVALAARDPGCSFAKEHRVHLRFPTVAPPTSLNTLQQRPWARRFNVSRLKPDRMEGAGDTRAQGAFGPLLTAL